MRFIEIDGNHFNADAIQTYYFTDSGHLTIIFKNGEVVTSKTGTGIFMRDTLSGARYIVQVIPCDAPIWAVWHTGDDTHYTERVRFLGLCADGELRAVQLCDGYFDVEDSSNLIGLYYEDGLSRFANLERKERNP